MLRHEVNESLIFCLMKLNRSTEALEIIDKMLKADTTDASLWFLLFRVHRYGSDLQGTIFALQRCLECHDEVADDWLKLAISYGSISDCFELKDPGNYCLGDAHKTYTQENPIRGWRRSREDRLGKERKIATTRRENISYNHVISKRMDTKDTCLLINTDTPRDVSQEHNQDMETVGQIHGMSEAHGDRSTLETCRQEELTEVKQYIQNHYYCFCTLCSLLIARFLFRKYLLHASALHFKKRQERLLKVSAMINGVSCASGAVNTATGKLLNDKCSTTVKQSETNSTDAKDNVMAILSHEKMIQRIHDFEEHWFPLLRETTLSRS